MSETNGTATATRTRAASISEAEFVVACKNPANDTAAKIAAAMGLEISTVNQKRSQLRSKYKDEFGMDQATVDSIIPPFARGATGGGVQGKKPSKEDLLTFLKTGKMPGLETETEEAPAVKVIEVKSEKERAQATKSPDVVKALKEGQAVQVKVVKAGSAA